MGARTRSSSPAEGDDVVGDQFIIYLDYLAGVVGIGSREPSIRLRRHIRRCFSFAICYAPRHADIRPLLRLCDSKRSWGLFSGPWLQPPSILHDYNYTDGLTIVKNTIDHLYAMLNGLASVKKNNFYLVDTRGTLTRDSSQPFGWANEIHPYSAGSSRWRTSSSRCCEACFPGESEQTSRHPCPERGRCRSAGIQADVAGGADARCGPVHSRALMFPPVPLTARAL